jgi:hypothetical protein
LRFFNYFATIEHPNNRPRLLSGYLQDRGTQECLAPEKIESGIDIMIRTRSFQNGLRAQRAEAVLRIPLNEVKAGSSATMHP